MAKVNFMFVIHFHQPVGQVRRVFERVFENSYKLLLETLNRYRDVKVSIHISGPLLLTLAERYPDWLSQVAKLAQHGSVELLGGSLGEAILPIIPREDMYAQVREYMELFEELLGFKPKGFWLPERVWEPSIVEALADNGIEYVLIDDSTLYRSGRRREESMYAWITENSGRRLKVLFIDTELRYVLPWRHPDEVISYMASRGDELGDKYLLWGSDAEKFGEWRDPMWAKWWLNEFFNKLREKRHEIICTQPREYLENYGVRGLIYLAPGSYDKMLEWSNGFFRNFLVKYPESNNMHKKMLRVREKLVKAGVGREAWRYYYMAQCNDSYWHGLFGGIYLTHLRQAVYENYIKSEAIAEESMNYYSEESIRIERTDFDYDGFMEVIVENRELNVYIKPSDGGTVFELDYKEKGFEHNYLNTMTRRYEPYLDGTGYRPDWYRRTSFREHIWALHATPADWIQNTPFIDLSDLALGEYKVTSATSDGVILRRIGCFYPPGGRPIEVLIEKKYVVNGSALTAMYNLKNIGSGVIEGLLGLELTVAPKLPLDVDAPVKYSVDGVEKGINEWYSGEASAVTLVSPAARALTIEVSSRTSTWIAPLTMPARTEKGIVENFEGLGVMPVYNLYLKPGDEFSQLIKLTVRH
ncbi:MAG: alpha-amylase/4-alpha-glucanotransferase domain-containing protein [Desulfurococcaceae archaeon]